MADTTTPVYSFVLPEVDGSDGTWGTKLNANLTALDGLLSGSTNLQNASFTGTVSFGGSTGTAGQVLKSQGAGANAIWTDDTDTTYTAGSGLSLTGTEFANTAPDQTVVLTAGASISVSGTYPSFTITNDAPDQTVALTGTGATTVTGTYPNFTIDSTDNNTTYTAGTGLTLTSTEFSVTDNGIGALQLNVSGNGTAGQVLQSDGDGTFTWANAGVGGNETLAQTLALGAVTGGTSISVSSGDNIIMAASSTVDGRDVSVDGTKLDGIEALADVTDTANVTAAGALMDSELTSEASVKALNQGVATTDSPTFAGLTVDTDTLYVDSTNNRVGVGTTSPSRPLTVNGFAHFGSTDCGVTAGDNGGVASAYALNAEGTVYKPFEIRTGAAGTGFYQATSGNVGIGQTAPSTLLHIGDAGAINPKLFIETTLTGNIPAGVTLSVDNTSGDVDLQTQSPSPNPKLNFNAATTTFQRSGAEKMRLNNTGLGIGTTSPSEELHVVGQSLMQGATSYGAAVCKVDLTGGSFGTGLRVEAGGSNTTGQTAYFQTNSSSKNVTFANGSTTSIFATFNKYQSSPAGHIRMTNNVLQYQVVSDERAKENIADAEDAGSKIDAIQVRQFDWIEGGLHEDFGFIAQELAPIVPVAVGGDPDSEEMMGVDASKLIPLMVKEIQSLRARVAALEE